MHLLKFKNISIKIIKEEDHVVDKNMSLDCPYNIKHKLGNILLLLEILRNLDSGIISKNVN